MEKKTFYDILDSNFIVVFYMKKAFYGFILDMI